MLPERYVAAALLVTTVAGCGPKDSGTAVETLWAEKCAHCHGADGRGDPRRLALHPRLDLTRSQLARSDAGLVLYRRIAYGDDAMPGFAGELPQGDMERLVAYVKRLAGR